MKRHHHHKHKPVMVTPAQVLEWIRHADLDDEHHHPVHNPYTGKRTLEDCLRHLRLIQHNYLRYQLDQIGKFAAKVCKETKQVTLPEGETVTLLLDTVLSFKLKLEEHLHWEESVAFPELQSESEQESNSGLSANLQRLLHEMQYDHREFEQTMQMLSGLTEQFKLVYPHVPHFCALMERLSVLQHELRTHFEDEEVICNGPCDFAPNQN